MKFAFYTFGCKVNQYETQAMEQLLTQKGHTLGAFDDDCDGYVVNTCSVTAMADRKNRSLIRRVRRAHPGALVAVCGCYSQRDPESVRDLGVDLVGGSGDRAAFVDALIQAAGERKILVDNALARRDFEPLPAGGLESRTRAMLKVQDGCRNFCTYCVIPYTRGPVRSATQGWAAEQAQALAARGYREIVLTGIEIASWGVDLPGKPGLADLTAAVAQAAPECRIRLGSLEPRCVTEEFCHRLAGLPNLCPHFHVSMQSGCDTVLKRMGRKYTAQEYAESLNRLRAHFPGCGITTDMIVGFPGETEAEFEESLDFIRRCRFSAMHIFPYSRRPGTPAARMPGQLTAQEKAHRAKRAGEVASEMALAYRESLAGKTLEVLFEERSGELETGHAGNFVRVYAPGEDLHNQLRTVEILRPFEDGVLGQIVNQI